MFNQLFPPIKLSPEGSSFWGKLKRKTFLSQVQIFLEVDMELRVSGARWGNIVVQSLLSRRVQVAPVEKSIVVTRSASVGGLRPPIDPEMSGSQVLPRPPRLVGFSQYGALGSTSKSNSCWPLPPPPPPPPPTSPPLMAEPFRGLLCSLLQHRNFPNPGN